MSDKEVNEYQLSISKKSSILRPLENGKFYTIAVNVQVRDAVEKIRDDGKIDVQYKVWLTGEGIIQNELKQQMTIKDKTKMSVKTRMRVENYYDSHDEKMSKEGFYRWALGKFIYYFPQVIKMFRKWEKENE